MEYYETKVRAILTNTINYVLIHPEKTFTQAELYFFRLWWIEQNENMKSNVRELVRT